MPREERRERASRPPPPTSKPSRGCYPRTTGSRRSCWMRPGCVSASSTRSPGATWTSRAAAGGSQPAKTGRPRWVTPPPLLLERVLGLCPRDDRHPARRVFEHVTGDRLRTAIGRACTVAAVPAFSPHDLTASARLAPAPGRDAMGTDWRTRRPRRPGDDGAHVHARRRRRARTRLRVGDRASRLSALAFDGSPEPQRLHLRTRTNCPELLARRPPGCPLSRERSRLAGVSESRMRLHPIPSGGEGLRLIRGPRRVVAGPGMDPR